MKLPKLLPLKKSTDQYNHKVLKVIFILQNITLKLKSLFDIIIIVVVVVVLLAMRLYPPSLPASLLGYILIWMVFEMDGRWPYSCCFMGCC